MPMLEKYKTRTSAAFDPARPLVYGKSVGVVQGHSLKAGDPIPEDIDPSVKRRLWLVRGAHYSEDYLPTPVDEEAETAPGEQNPNLDPDDSWMSETDGVSVEKGSGGWYTITASWLEEPVKERGEEAVKAKASELRAEGPPTPPAGDAGDDTGE